MRISEEIIKEIIDKADIVNIISSRIKIDKKGKDYIGLCPFHNDNNPSLSVSPAKKIYKCFSCGAGGNVVNFVKEFDHISFMEALKIVGKTVDIEIDTDQKVDQNMLRYHSLMEEVTKFYSVYLTSTNEGQKALSYLKKRNIDENIIKRFKIGLSSFDNDLLYREFKDKYSEIDLINTGMIRSTQEGSKYFDVFKGRIMFPLADFDGYIVGFSGRIYEKSDESKYMNSFDNVIFNKSNILFNYKEALNDIKKLNFVYVFEGFMDVIAAYRAGINNSVATMGTAFTNEQIRAIKKITNNIILCYDGDLAGVEATKKTINLLNSFNINVRIVLLPEGNDPDDYLNQYGVNNFVSYLENNTMSAFDYLYKIYKRTLNIEDINSILSFKNKIFDVLASYKSDMLNEIAFKRMSDDISLNTDVIKEDYLKHFSKTTYRTQIPEFRKPAAHKTVKKRRKQQYLLCEKKLIFLAYQNKDKCAEIFRKLSFNYVNETHYLILSKFNNYYKTSQKIEERQLKEILTDKELEVFNSIINQKLTFRNDQDIDFFVNKINEYINELYWYRKKTANKDIDVEKYLKDLGSKIKTRNDIK
ncbi:MAG: DNA primase [Bacilli bacterium]